MILAILQPSYFPGIDFFSHLLAADVIVWADTFQFHRHSTINRAAIKTISGPNWLTIPVQSQNPAHSPRICDMTIDQHQNWRRQHLRSLEINYRNAPYFFFLSELESLYETTTISLDHFIWSSMLFILQKLGYRIESSTPIGSAHLESLGKPPKRILPATSLTNEPDRTRRLLDWLRTTGCNTYLLPEKHLKLIRPSDILQSHYQFLLFKTQIISYHQQFHNFVPHLSALDLLLNEGELSAAIIQKNMVQLP